MQDFEQKDIEKLKITLDQFSEKYRLSSSDIVKLFESLVKLFESKDHLPLSIFNDRLSPFETVVKFMRENLNKKFKEISLLLNKDVSASWTAYRNAAKKYPEKFTYSPSKYDIPLKDLHSSKLSLLELISSHLKEKFNLNFHEIGKILHRNEKTIWTCCSRARKKRVK